MTLTYGPKLSLEYTNCFYIPVERMGPNKSHMKVTAPCLCSDGITRPGRGGLSTLRGPLPVVMDTPMTYRRPGPIPGLARRLLQGREPRGQALTFARDRSSKSDVGWEVTGTAHGAASDRPSQMIKPLRGHTLWLAICLF